ncbi:MAG: Uncharacterized protein G01um101448_191 [Parcubacteria group bacterium Gr01-1014_48]|nr:MAG: Uncharacterized protein Greene041614_942 [Parcubacteria group bacterium Greene0416_14]TSC74315.1 MAG: Uncharacterized protein G01um101448_191 [Parcubacteria group bacterium Gr01-1014_48]TSD01015.1 MAG: Uncharacterized protein Greene101415_516 [Parcubacteria group bacterium Greene1014_15]TSD07680.1 MAG: Uncharacterized protein Greene07144_834 [Parcubacteria group bacterium Greene0714_4]
MPSSPFQDNKNQDQKLEQIRKQEQEDLAKLLAARYRLDYIDLSVTTINSEALRLVTEEEARKAHVAVFHQTGKKISVALLTPNAEEAKKIIANLEGKGFVCTIFMVTLTSLEHAWLRYKDLSYAKETTAGMLTVSHEQIEKVLEKVKSTADIVPLITEVLATKQTNRISRIFEVLLAGALALEASDIHLEPEEGFVRVRYRLDGILIEVSTLESHTYSLLLNRVKLLSGLKFNVEKTSQDGRFTIRITDRDIEIRTSIIPGAYDESVVMRLLDPRSIALPLEELGFNGYVLEVINNQLEKPNGMILTTGPTGSGKTTTLYSFLRKIHSPELKIITIEDPIEYHLPGVVQTQVKKQGYTFATGLRSALRQDPDVIMVGEIRDEDTAEIAIDAALTGHLVFSTLHTNDAAGTFSRLIDLGVEPKVISSAINIAMAQRLVRKLCKECKKEIPLIGEVHENVLKIIDTIVRDEFKPRQTEKMWVGVGCLACGNMGYKGRVSILEAILVDEAVDEIIRSNPSEREVWAAARPQGILTMQQDGIIKVLDGVTSIEELKRVIDLAVDKVV